MKIIFFLIRLSSVLILAEPVLSWGVGQARQPTPSAGSPTPTPVSTRSPAPLATAETTKQASVPVKASASAQSRNPASMPVPAPIPTALTPAKTVVKSSLSNLLPKLLLDIEEKYSRSPTISAQFTQVDNNVTLGKKKTTSGKIFVKRPSKIRWETEKPDPNLLVSDGKRFWFYTPPFDEGEHGQLIEKPASQVQSKLATALLAGEFSKVPGIKVKQQSPNLFLIVPKSGTSGTVIQAMVTINIADQLIEKVALSHRGGNRSEISLSQIELGKPLDDSSFVFKAPPNTDLVQE